MRLEEKDGLRVIYPNENCLLYSASTNSYHEMVYLGIYANPSEYLDVNINEIEGYEPKKEVDKLKQQVRQLDEISLINMEAIAEVYELILGGS